MSMSSRLATFARQNSLSGSDIYSSRFKDNETAPFRNSMQVSRDHNTFSVRAADGDRSWVVQGRMSR